MSPSFLPTAVTGLFPAQQLSHSHVRLKEWGVENLPCLPSPGPCVPGLTLPAARLSGAQGCLQLPAPLHREPFGPLHKAVLGAFSLCHLIVDSGVPCVELFLRHSQVSTGGSGWAPIW